MKIPLKLSEAEPGFEAFRLEILDVFNKHTGAFPADRMLAVAAYTVGQLIAMQDQRSMTSAMAMELVGENIELGNQHAVNETFAHTAGNG